MAFTKVCKIEDIIPGTGVCALVAGERTCPTKAEEVLD